MNDISAWKIPANPHENALNKKMNTVAIKRKL